MVDVPPAEVTEHTPKFHDITIENLTATNARNAVQAMGNHTNFGTPNAITYASVQVPVSGGRYAGKHQGALKNSERNCRFNLSRN
jgi:hypothetical protein